MKTFQQLVGDFKPTFYTVDSVRACADAINKPHEDYPLRVDRTIGLIHSYMGIIDSQDDTSPHFVSLFDLRSMHSQLFQDANPHHIKVGAYRDKGVKTLTHEFPEPHEISDLMVHFINNKIIYDPLETVSQNVDRLIHWYTLFESIHPFEDGNGRIGGIVLAAYSYLCNFRSNREVVYMAPLQ